MPSVGPARVQPRSRASSNGFRGITACILCRVSTWRCGITQMDDERQPGRARQGSGALVAVTVEKEGRSARRDQTAYSHVLMLNTGLARQTDLAQKSYGSLARMRQEVSMARRPPRQRAYEGAQPRTGSIAIGATALRAPTTPRYTAPSVSPPASTQDPLSRAWGWDIHAHPQLLQLVFFFFPHPCSPCDAPLIHLPVRQPETKSNRPLVFRTLLSHRHLL